MIIPIYKPIGPTSHDIIDQIRKITGQKKVGHAGTLDPLAKGVLVIGIGRESTKKLGELVQKEKEYLAQIRLGQFSTTDDAEGEKQPVKITRIPELGDIKKALQKFEGTINQVPPLYSAIKIGGKPAYKLARQGKIKQEALLKSRKVEIKKIQLVKYHWPFLDLKIITGPGVYIRALARDLGKELKTGGYLAKLERTRVGQYTKTQAYTLETFQNLWQGRRAKEGQDLL